MSCLILLALVGATPSSQLNGASFESLDQAVAEIQPTMQTGTLLVTRGDCLAVRVYTQSPYTHVGAVVIRNGQPIVYDSANGVGVRCQSLEKYLRSQSPGEIHIFHPQQRLSQGRAGRFETWLDGQLGEPYAVKHFLSGERGKGLHCAEYVTDALIASRLIKARQPARVSPASLVEGVTKHGIYSNRQTVRVEEPPRPLNPESDWCEGLWVDTKSCTSDCWKQTRGWFLCQ